MKMRAVIGLCVVLLVESLGSFVKAEDISQAGGLLALSQCVQKLEGQVAALISQVGSI